MHAIAQEERVVPYERRARAECFPLFLDGDGSLVFRPVAEVGGGEMLEIVPSAPAFAFVSPAMTPWIPVKSILVCKLPSRY